MRAPRKPSAAPTSPDVVAIAVVAMIVQSTTGLTLLRARLDLAPCTLPVLKPRLRPSRATSSWAATKPHLHRRLSGGTLTSRLGLGTELPASECARVRVRGRLRVPADQAAAHKPQLDHHGEAGGTLAFRLARACAWEGVVGQVRRRQQEAQRRQVRRLLGPWPVPRPSRLQPQLPAGTRRRTPADRDRQIAASRTRDCLATNEERLPARRPSCG